jgi:NADPH:quinone reductase-like Zn-dependent oxidoreductase
MKIIKLDNKATATVGTHTKPSPEDGQVLIKVAYSALDTAFEDVAKRTFIPGSLLHNLKVEPLVAGWHYSGTIESLGASLPEDIDLKVGDLVFGHLQYAPSSKQGSLSEYITVPVSDCAKVPSGVSLDVAAAITTESLTAMQAMRDLGGLSKGKKVLIIAAGGGVGTQAVQVAKLMKASAVHGVCSTRHVSKVQELGADLVIDRTKQDITKDLDPASYDLIFDTTGKYSFFSLKYALKPKGSLVNTIPGVVTTLFSWFIRIVYNKQYRSVMVQSKQSDLELVGSWLQTGAIRCPIDGTYNIKDFHDARERHYLLARRGRSSK